jgi:phosphomannomutase
MCHASIVHRTLSSVVELMNSSIDKTLPKMYVDCSCGVGSIGIKEVVRLLADVFPIQTFNHVGERSVNDECGSEHVQVRFCVFLCVTDFLCVYG